MNNSIEVLEKLGIRQVPLANALVLLITLKSAHPVPFA